MAAKFGPYTLLRRIASGGMGEVYLAQLQREGGFTKTLALKMMLECWTEQHDFAQLFQTEATIAARLNHTNIVQVFDHGTIEGKGFLAMEYVEGPDLAAIGKLLPSQKIDEALVTEIGIQVCRGLAHAHTRKDLKGRQVGTIHGDISPSNILISIDGAVKLTDFGLARLRCQTSSGDGKLVGKYAYMSPEQTRGEALSPASDLFSLGLVLYELCCGCQAYPMQTPIQLTLEAIQQADHVPIRTASRIPLSPGFVQLFDRLLATEPNQRYHHATELADDLQKACPAAGQQRLCDWVLEFHEQIGPVQQHPEPTQVAASPVCSASSAPSRSDPRSSQKKTSSSKQIWVWASGLFLIAVLSLGWWVINFVPQSRPLAPSGLKAQLVEEKKHPPIPRPAEHTQRKKQTKRIAKSTQPNRSQEPKPKTTLKIEYPNTLVSSLDHNRVLDKNIRIQDHASHLLRFQTQNKKNEILLRLSPQKTDSATASWYLYLRATPWMRISLNGKQQGQTPRSGIVIQPGKHILSLQRDEQVFSLVFVVLDQD